MFARYEYIVTIRYKHDNPAMETITLPSLGKVIDKLMMFVGSGKEDIVSFCVTPRKVTGDPI